MSAEDTKIETNFGDRAFISVYIAATCVATVCWLLAIGLGAIDVVSWIVS